MKKRMCMYCTHLFGCTVDEVKDRCIQFELNPSMAEMYRDYVEMEIGRERNS